MRLRRFAFGSIALAALLYLLFYPPTPEIGEPQLVEQQFAAMGTWFSVTIWLDDAEQRATAKRAIDEAEAGLRAYARRWKPDGDGTLASINDALAAGERVEVPESMRALFEAAADWRRASDGAFDARSGALISLWGFDDDEHFRESPPDATKRERLAAALTAAPTYDAPEYGPAPAVRWNFGAIAKGEAVDAASASLTAAGFSQHIVNAGGDLVVRGTRGPRAWRVAVRHPRPGVAQRLLAAVDVGDEAVFTSGDYERFFEFDDRRYHHILDPADGLPAQGLRSVTVIDADATAADAASTAIFVAGADWRDMAHELEMDTVLVMHDDGSLSMTEAARTRFRVLADAPVRDAAPNDSP